MTTAVHGTTVGRVDISREHESKRTERTGQL